jgi:hypothetical protein
MTNSRSIIVVLTGEVISAASQGSKVGGTARVPCQPRESAAADEGVTWSGVAVQCDDLGELDRVEDRRDVEHGRGCARARGAEADGEGAPLITAELREADATRMRHRVRSAPRRLSLSLLPGSRRRRW